MALFAICSICGKKKLGIFVDADRVCSACETKKILQATENEKKCAEPLLPKETNNPSDTEHESIHPDKHHEDESKSDETIKPVEEDRRKDDAREHIRQIEGIYAAYDTMIALIQDYPIVISDEKAKKLAASFVNDIKYSTITKKTDMSKLGNFVVVDVETTGLRYTSHEIIDIAAVRFRNFEPVAKFSTLLSSSKPIPAEIIAINHITNEMVEGKPCFQQVATSLVDFIGEDNIVGHNLPFDLKFIIHYGADVSIKKRKYYDTLIIAQKTIKKTKMKWDKDIEDYVEDYDSDGVDNYKLGTLCSYLGIINRDAHRAESDAIATGLLFHELAKIRKG